MLTRAVHDKQAVAGSWQVAGGPGTPESKWLINRNPATWGWLTLAQKG